MRLAVARLKLQSVMHVYDKDTFIVYTRGTEEQTRRRASRDQPDLSN